MRQTLASLPSELGKVLRLSLFEELPMQKVAERLEISLSTAKRRLFLGAKLYRERLEERLASREGIDR